MKYVWRKTEKDIYLPTTEPTLIRLPKMQYYIIDGEGDPNKSSTFQETIETLYSLSYGMKMLPKKGITPNGYYDYTVYPLEGVWDIKDKEKEFSIQTKDNLTYSLMIRQPDFVNEELALVVIDLVKKKKNTPLLDNVRFETIEEGLCIQMMHIGSYDDEQHTFDVMEKFCKENNLKRISKIHREIYLSDPRKVVPDKMKTVLRFRVKSK